MASTVLLSAVDALVVLLSLTSRAHTEMTSPTLRAAKLTARVATSMPWVNRPNGLIWPHAAAQHRLAGVTGRMPGACTTQPPPPPQAPSAAGGA